MRKLHKTAAVVAVLGSVGLLGAGTAYADGGAGGYDHRPQSSNQSTYQQQSSGGRDHGKSGGRKVIIRQSTACRTFDDNVDVFGELRFRDHLGFPLREIERPDVQVTRLGSSHGCNNIIRL
ncbi:hypothetical protein [Streptomyces sp. GS7]|uniref:hypothetical protein n=1 Tax=Streptomyces sp. GS7 TaxID=2692234 RepID=UPI001316091C|nr:hypothetical protein [Streptomyces sp. GS7]QHC22921.1 hypothetical protein GR130_17305 [Streptomyces sp. GS7]